jgi:oligopeptidase B
VAARRPVRRVLHGEEVVDDYGWLRDRDDPATMAHLTAENAYTDAVLAGQAGLRERLYGELAARRPEAEVSAPWDRAGWTYYTRLVAGGAYPVWCRTPLGGGPEQVLLDGNALAGEYFAAGVVEVSPDARLLAYSVDLVGDEVYTLRFRDLHAGAELPDAVGGTYYGLGWAADSRSVLYTRLDAAKRPYQVWRHVLGGPADELVYEETDEQYELTVSASRDGRWLLLRSAARASSEVRAVPADDPAAAPLLLVPRRPGVEYDVDPQGPRWLMVTNDGAPDFRLLAGAPGDWAELLPARDGVRLAAVVALRAAVAVAERSGGRTSVRVLAGPAVPAAEAGVAEFARNEEFDSAEVQVRVSSLVDPPAVLALDVRTGARRERWRQEVLDYDPGRYAARRLVAVADDGVEVPVSLVSRRDVPVDGTAPGVLTGYGAYEWSYDPDFYPLLLPLLDRGVVCAIAHIRGGGELGRGWWEAGRLAAKPTTFTDFLSCARMLVTEGWVAPERLAARGGSAGGLLMGAVLARAPQQFRAVVAEVPFVDVVTTMLDPTLPLTTLEYDEWGDPRRPEDYAWMRAYSPYDNVPAGRLPAVLVTASLYDPRVSYHEPAKWVAKLRAAGGGGGPVLLRTELGAAGHGGPSGRYARWRHEAFVLAFLLVELGSA